MNKPITGGAKGLFALIESAPRDMQPFIEEMTRIYDIAPHPGFLIKEDGTFEQLPLAEPYRSLINHLTEMRDNYIKRHYPEHQQQKQ